MLSFHEYQKAARRTSGLEVGNEKSKAVAVMGLIGETGELVDHLKKVIGHGHPPDSEYIEKEIGDVLWYLAEMASVEGHSLRDIAMDLSEGDDFATRQEIQAKHWQRTPGEQEVGLVCLSLAGYVGRLADELARHIAMGNDSATPVKQSRYLLSCVLTCLFHFAIQNELSMESIAEKNLAKLRARYPDGFSADRSKNRVE